MVMDKKRKSYTGEEFQDGTTFLDLEDSNSEGKRLVEVAGEWMTMELSFLKKVIVLRKGGTSDFALEQILRAVLEATASTQGTLVALSTEGLYTCLTIEDKAKDPCKKTTLSGDVSHILWGKALVDKQGEMKNSISPASNQNGAFERSLTVPIIFGEKAFGMILIGGRKSVYTQSHQELIEMATNIIAPDLALMVGRDDSAFERVCNGGAGDPQRIANAVNGALDSVWEWDLASNFFNFSGQLQKNLGYDNKAPVTAEQWLSLLHPEDVESYRANLADHVIGRSDRFYLEHRVRAADGSYKNLLSRGLVLRDDNGKVILLSGLLTEIAPRKDNRKKAPDQEVFQANRQEVIITLTDGLAHEINNPINGVLNFAQLIVDENELDSNSNKYAVKIIEQSKRIAKIVRNLQAFSQQGVKEKSSHSLAEILDQTVSMVKSASKKRGISIRVSISDNLPNISCVAPKIKQVFLDLMSNAIYALGHEDQKEDKELVIHTEAIIEKKGRRWIRTCVSDNGPGIPKDIIDRIFDPFFTTKSRSIASGMGLAAAYGTVKEHDGSLFVESEEGQGTRFYIDLPTVNQSRPDKGSNGDSVVEDI